MNPLSSLNSDGWNALRLPQEGIGPFDVLGRANGRWKKVATLDQICPPSSQGKLPEVTQDHTVDIQRKESGGWSFGIGLDALKDLLKRFGLSGPAASADWKNSKSVQIEFKNPLKIEVLYKPLSDYVKQGKLDGEFLEQFLGPDNAPTILVISAVLKSNAISIIGSKDRDADISASVAEIRNVGEVKGSVSNQSAANDALIYNGPELLTFAFQAYSLSRVHGKWKLADAGVSDEYSFGDDENANSPVVIEGLIDIDASSASQAA